MVAMREVIEAVQEAGLRDRVKVMVGGAPVTKDFADEIGADFFGPDSTSGKDFARRAVAEG
jgi:5-methyltetrahydrofolate--homocysteine methyltransferase